MLGPANKMSLIDLLLVVTQEPSKTGLMGVELHALLYDSMGRNEHA